MVGLVLVGGGGLDQAADEIVGLDPFGLGVEVGHDAMPEHGVGHGADVAHVGEISPVQHGPGGCKIVASDPRRKLVCRLCHHLSLHSTELDVQAAVPRGGRELARATPIRLASAPEITQTEMGNLFTVVFSSVAWV